MKFLPFENITFKTKVDSEEILNRIRENIEPPKLNSSIQSGRFDPTMLIPLGMIVFLYVLTTGAFKYESVKSIDYLAQLFEAEIE